MCIKLDTAGLRGNLSINLPIVSLLHFMHYAFQNTLLCLSKLIKSLNDIIRQILSRNLYIYIYIYCNCCITMIDYWLDVALAHLRINVFSK